MTVTRKILSPTIALFLLILVTLIGLVFFYANTNLQAQETVNLGMLRQSFDNATTAQQQLTLALATQLADNPEVQAALAAGDRQRLLDLTLPAYRILSAQYGLSQAQFHVPPATSFLRLHQPDQFGDDLSRDRPTVLAANQTHQPVAGLEIERGGLSMRGVVPVTYQGQPIGTVEYGLDAGLPELEELKREYGVDWQILVSRDPTRPPTSTLQPPNSRSPLPDLLLQASTLAQPFFADEATYRRATQGVAATYWTRFNMLNYVILSAPLRDYSGQVIGVLDIIQDRTVAIQFLVGRILAASVALIVLMSLGTAATAWLTTRSLRPIGQLLIATRALEQGDLSHTVTVISRDELGALARAFNSMTLQMRGLIDSLETRVEMRTAQLQASAEIGRAATAVLDPDRLMKQVTALITSRFGYYYAATLLVNASGEYAELREASGPGDTAWALKQSGYKVPVNGESLISAALSSRQFQIRAALPASARPGANPLLPDARSEIVLPLRVGERVLGVLDVYSTQAEAFDASNAAVLQAMAAQIAIALENAAQYRREQTRGEQTAGLLAAALELSGQPDQLKLFERLSAVTRSLLNADGVGLWFLQEDDTLELQHTVNVGPTDLTGRQLRRGEGLIGQVYSAGVIGRVPDYATWPGRSQVFADAPFHSAMGVPLLWQNRILGVLAITRSTPGQPFTLDDENFAQLLAAPAAAALDNLRLRAEQQQALANLDALNRRLTGEAWQAERLGETLAYERRRSSHTADTPSGPLLRVPIALRGTPIGAITLEDTPTRILSADEHALIDGVAQQLALALENQRLTDVAQRAAQRDRAIAETADKIHQPTDLDAILRVAVNELSRITGIRVIGAQLGFALNGPAAPRQQENKETTGRESDP